MLRVLAAGPAGRWPEKLMCVREQRVTERGWCWCVYTVENGFWNSQNQNALKNLLLESHTVLLHGRVWSMRLLQCLLECFAPRQEFSYCFIALLPSPNKWVQQQSWLEISICFPLTVIKQMVKRSWTEVLKGLMNFSPSASGQKSDPSDKKHVWKIQPCHQFNSPEHQRYISPGRAPSNQSL